MRARPQRNRLVMGKVPGDDEVSVGEMVEDRATSEKKSWEGGQVR